MSQVLTKIKDMSSDDILKQYYLENGTYDSLKIPVDIVSICEKIGIKLGSIDFRNLEKIPPFSEHVKKKGSIIGAVYINNCDTQIIYSNRWNDDIKTMSETDKEDNLLRRQRFTIAHELAHCCLHMNPQDKNHIEYRSDQDESFNDNDERRANIFAGELLIPTFAIKDILDLFEDAVSISYLANVFYVSKHVMKARLEHLMKVGEILPIKLI